MRLCQKLVSVRSSEMISNEMKLRFKAISSNESFARVCISAFLASANPSLDELGDIKTAVSEAVTNCVVHAYPKGEVGDIELYASIDNSNIYISITDFGCGIDNIEQAKQPFFTTKPTGERSGMGFTVMEGFMDDLIVTSDRNSGTKVEMTKVLGDIQEVSCGV